MTGKGFFLSLRAPVPHRGVAISALPVGFQQSKCLSMSNCSQFLSEFNGLGPLINAPKAGKIMKGLIRVGQGERITSGR